jgi:hypothetical protein
MLAEVRGVGLEPLSMLTGGWVSELHPGSQSFVPFGRKGRATGKEN